MSLSRPQVMALAKKLRELEAEIERACSAKPARMTRAADTTKRLCGYHGFNFTHDKCVYCGLTADAFYRLKLCECPSYFRRDVGGPQKAALDRVLAKVADDAPTKPRPRVADDFEMIRSRLAEMRRERMICKTCGKRHGEIHTPECGFSGTVVEAECQ